ncbi:MAG: hypothetical protein K8S13_13270 [Desulfobacula sp.]|uniref:hypothetical protein n=1 Tax=Desulfobacula sp. TaxID=2593537 RepID=UPI0025C0E0B0|nr:hypothetical protein [Desulfobacula sp.]MCD4720809.1 hypothetical protein [Desulfobacula sp.]
MKNWKFSKDRYPLSGEMCAFSNIKIAKTSLLLFDRIFVSTRTKANNNDPFKDVPEDFTFGINKANSKTLMVIEKKIETDSLSSSANFMDLHDQVRRQVYLEFGIQATSVYNSENAFKHEFPNGQSLAYQAALNNLSIPNESDLEWRQVVDFRKDVEAKQKYRDLRFWLEYGLNAKTLQHATDIINKRLDDYEWALKKHGIKTVTGALSKILSTESLAAITVGTGISALLGGPIGAILSGGLLITAQCSVWVAERRLELMTIQREQFPEVMWIHEAKKLFKNKPYRFS